MRKTISPQEVLTALLQYLQARNTHTLFPYQKPRYLNRGFFLAKILLTMEYLIFLELGGLFAYLVWAERQWRGFVKELRPVAEKAIPQTEKPSLPILPPAPQPSTVEIVKILPDGSVAKIRDEHVGHSDIEVVWQTPNLGIRHPDGRVQMTKEEAAS